MAVLSDFSTKIRALAKAGKTLNTVMRYKELCQQIVDLTADALCTEFSDLYIKNERSKLVLVAGRTVPGGNKLEELKIGDGLIGWVAEQDEPAYVPNVTSDPRCLKGIDRALSALAVPLKYNGNLIGVLGIRSLKESAFATNDLELLQFFANQAAVAIQATRDRDDSRARIIELKARSDRHELIYKIGLTYSQDQTLKEAMQNIVEMVATTLHYSYTSILLLDLDLEELKVISTYGCGEIEGLSIPISQGATGYAVRHKGPVIIPDVTTDPRYVRGIRGGRSELAVPIICRDVVLGVIDVESPILDAFDQEDIKLLDIVAFYASSAINAARRKEHLEAEHTSVKRLQIEVRLLNMLNQAFAFIDDVNTLFSEVLRLIAEVLNWQSLVIWMIEPENGRLIAELTHGMAIVKTGTYIQLGKGTAGLAAESNQPTLENTDKLISTETGTITRLSEMAVPLWDGCEINRVLHVMSEAATFTRGDLNMLAAIGTQVSNISAAIRLRNETKQQIKTLDNHTRRLDLLIRVTRSLTSRMSIDELLDELLRLCMEAFEINVCAVLLIDRENSILLRKASIGYDNDAPVRLAIGEGITGHVAATGVPILVSDVTKDPRYITGVSGSRAEMAVPLKVFDQVIGVLDAESIEEQAFNEEDLDLFTCFAAQATVAIHNADLTAKIEQNKNG